MSFKTIIGTVGLCMSLLSLSATAVPMYISNTDGLITGVTGLVVGTDIYDMTLHDGSFDQLFADVGVGALYSQEFAHDATTALVEYTNFLPIPVHSIIGCERTITCWLATAYALNEIELQIDTYVDLVIDHSPDQFVQLIKTSVYTNASSLNYATWEISDSNIPEPPMVLLIASGLVVLAIARRKVRA